MAVSKKKGKWYAQVYLGTKNGKQEYETSTGYEKKEDAQLAEIEIKRSVIESEHKVCTKESFTFVAEKWLAMRKKMVTPATYRTNECYYNTYIKDYFKDYAIKDIEPMDVTTFMIQIDRAPETISKAMNLLKQILDFAVLLKQIRSNPCIGIKKPSIKRRKKSTWSEKEIKKFLSLKEVKNATCYTAFLILFTTGMRPGEVCGLRWSDWEDDYFIPTVGIDTKREETDLKNEKAHDNVYLGQQVITQLKRIKIAQESIYLSNGKQLPADGYINAIPPDFRPMTVAYLRKTFEKIIKKNSLPTIRLYDARHSLGTNMMRNGINPKQVSEILRHTSVKTTLDNYSHVDKQMYKNTIQQYNNNIFKKAK